MSIVNDLLDAYVSVETSRNDARLAATGPTQNMALGSTSQSSNPQATSTTGMPSMQSVPRWAWMLGGASLAVLLVALVMKH